jgi:DNA-binding transcriptional ArsR family regulator
MMTEQDSIQTVTDSRVLAAMSHPVRRRLLDALTVDGPSTVTTLAKRTGEAIGNVSHHVKVLTQASLVEEAPELARDRRERWWRVASATRRWSSASFQSDPASQAVAEAAASLNLEHQMAKVRAWQARAETADAAWVEASFSTDTWLQLTPDELKELSEQVVALLAKWRQRAPLDDGMRRESVFVFARGVPAEP